MDFTDKPYTFITVETIQESNAQEGFVYVCHNDHKVEFICPCGCKALITLNIYPYLKPSWKVNGKSISPSIRNKYGCKSHFTITDGIAKKHLT